MDGERAPYTDERVDRMYRFLDAHGELYFIEVLENGRYAPIGDVTFWQGTCPSLSAILPTADKKSDEKSSQSWWSAEALWATAFCMLRKSSITTLDPGAALKPVALQLTKKQKKEAGIG